MNEQQSLLKWISDKNGGLLVYSYNLNKWDVIALITDKCYNYNIYIITNNPNETTNSINKYRKEKSNYTCNVKEKTREQLKRESLEEWSKEELIYFPMVTYNNTEQINEIINNTEIDIIIFDDAEMICMLSDICDLKKIKSKILVLCSWGNTINQLNNINEKLPSLNILNFNISQNDNMIKWKVNRIEMGQIFQKMYDEINNSHIGNESGNDIANILRMTTLYNYTEQDVYTKYQDTKYDYTNVNKNFFSFDVLNNNSPKLSTLLDEVIGNWPAKQIICTKYNHKYGIDLILYYMKLLSDLKLNPYENPEILTISTNHDYNHHINILHKFNQLENCILITNTIPLININNTSIIHIVDNYCFNSTKKIIDKCDKRNLLADGLLINIYILVHPSQQSIEQHDCEKFLTNVTSSIILYNDLTTIGNNVLLHNNLGAVVITK